MTAKSPLIFVSHGSQDASCAGLLVNLLRAAFDLRPNHIRCTSVDGYRLPIGVDTDHQLRSEIVNARALVGLLSRQSISSTYVLFELGARWGTGGLIAPLIVPGADYGVLKGPLARMSALHCESRGQLQQLLDNLSTALESPIQSAASYDAHLTALSAWKSAPKWLFSRGWNQ